MDGGVLCLPLVSNGHFFADLAEDNRWVGKDQNLTMNDIVDEWRVPEHYLLVNHYKRLPLIQLASPNMPIVFSRRRRRRRRRRR